MLIYKTIIVNKFVYNTCNICYLVDIRILDSRTTSLNSNNLQLNISIFFLILNKSKADFNNIIRTRCLKKKLTYTY